MFSHPGFAVPRSLRWGLPTVQRQFHSIGIAGCYFQHMARQRPSLLTVSSVETIVVKRIGFCPIHSSSRGAVTSTRRLPLAVLVVTAMGWYVYNLLAPSTSKTLSPLQYSAHTISSKNKLSDVHVQVTIRLSNQAGQSEYNQGNIIISHFMIKNPDLMIERPYTPVNDFEEQDVVDLVVKRVKAGEVGRCVAPSATTIAKRNDDG